MGRGSGVHVENKEGGCVCWKREGTYARLKKKIPQNDTEPIKQNAYEQKNIYFSRIILVCCGWLACGQLDLVLQKLYEVGLDYLGLSGDCRSADGLERVA